MSGAFTSPPWSRAHDGEQDKKGKRKLSNAGVSLFETLEVEKGASNFEVKKAYRKLALRWHPDKNANDPSASEKFKEINRAYTVLTDEKKRKIYDEHGSWGLYIAEQFSDDFVDVYFALKNPCLKCLLGTCFILTCCFCCLCCCCCCNFCCGKCRTEDDEDNVYPNLTEEGDDSDGRFSPVVVDQPGSTPVTVYASM